MRVSYDRELQQLPVTFESARREPVGQLQEALQQLAAGPARIVGTGGTLALARLTVDLHQTLGGEVAAVTTPLGLLASPPSANAGAIFFSARAKHPDAALCLEHLESANYRPAILVTHRSAGELEGIAGPEIQIATVRRPDLGEGFLATNSIIAMATSMIRAAGEDLPDGLLDGLDEYVPPTSESRQVLVVYPPHLEAVAIDFETRCSELGLISVQLSDLRNVAHGRHTGLARRARETTVLVLSDEQSSALADRVGALLARSGARAITWYAPGSPRAACLRLLGASMRAVGQIASAQGVEPSRPAVPEFGRSLYRLPIRRMLRPEPSNPVDLKLQALGADPGQSTLRKKYQEAERSWRKAIAAVRFRGLVLDYDGTVCHTAERFDLPGSKIREQLMRVLADGMVLGFASGRGRSLHEDLRKWVPQEHRGQVHLGLYNGATLVCLDEELGDLRQPSPLMEAVDTRLRSSAFAEMVELSPRTGQVSVEAKATSYLQPSRLADLVSEVLREDPRLEVKVARSAHSVDVLAAGTSKVRVLDRVRSISGGEVLAIGDRGEWGGNDFELLAESPWSVTVDRCSVDPTRCWNVDLRGRRGPPALIAVIEALKPNASGGVRLRLPDRPSGGMIDA
jgi:hydroxymethylpyrimidine pyrophosphatase-like HAD family hydrolase